MLLTTLQLIATTKEPCLEYVGQETENFIIRWGFQEKSDFVYDMITNIWQWPTAENGVTFEPTLVKPGDLIFARNAPEFFEKMHPHIKHPYIMLTMGEWRESVKDEWLDKLEDPKIIAWFSIHACERTHPKFHLLPIGVYQVPEIYEKRVELSKLFKELRKQPKTSLLYSNHGDMFNKKPERKELDEFLAKQPWATRSSNVQGLEFVDYMKEMAQYKFTVSPRGYGIDCYRTWEAVLAGSIPIVRSSQLDPLYKNLPILIIDKWEDLSEEFLNQKYKEITSKKYDLSPLFIEYWLDKINATRIEFLATYNKRPWISNFLNPFGITMNHEGESTRIG